MRKLTITLIILAVLCSGVGGFILGAQNAQMTPALNIVNNTTDDYSYVEPTSKYTNYTKKSTAKQTEDTTPVQPPIQEKKNEPKDPVTCSTDIKK